MRERGRYQLQLMKTRNSGGVGQKIDLAFDIDTLRIFDCDDDDDGDNYSNSSGNSSSSSIMDKIKRGAESQPQQREDPSEGSGLGKIRAETDSTKLKNFINNLGSDE
jgi:hypothetical protein